MSSGSIQQDTLVLKDSSTGKERNNIGLRGIRKEHRLLLEGEDASPSFSSISGIKNKKEEKPIAEKKYGNPALNTSSDLHVPSLNNIKGIDLRLENNKTNSVFPSIHKPTEKIRDRTSPNSSISPSVSTISSTSTIPKILKTKNEPSANNSKQHSGSKCSDDIDKESTDKSKESIELVKLSSSNELKSCDSDSSQETNRGIAGSGDKLFIRVRSLAAPDISNTAPFLTSVKSLEGYPNTKGELGVLSDDSLKLHNVDICSSRPSSCIATSSGVGTSLMSLSAGTSSKDGTGELSHSSNVSYTNKSRSSGATDFWSQVAQQVAYIDSTSGSGSTRRSLLLNCGHHIPPASLNGTQYQTQDGSHLENAVATVAGGSCGSVEYRPVTTSPTSLSPLPLAHQRFSFRDRRRRGKLSRFYSQDPEPVSKVGTEIRVLQQPLLNTTENPVYYSPTLSHGRNSLATVWGGPQDLHTRYIRPGSVRGLNHGNSQMGLPGASRKRKQSSWEESVSLQRRRSIASREEAREWRDRFLANNLPLPSKEEEEEEIPDLSLPPIEKDLRYYFQHPYVRLFATYFIIICNFLLFAEDPISHSHAESRIPMVGNVFSFVLTKYPPDWRWALIKVLMWLLAIICGLVFGKLIVHNILCGKILRLKMFRDEQGSWIAMFLTVIVSLYVFSHAYNLLLLIFYNKSHYHIDSRMGITYASVMKTAACGTWVGDLITALMVTDVMLQDNLYPEWAPTFRKLWRRSNIPRILIFWVGSVLATAVVVTLIVSDYISWDRLNHDFIASTELSRAFLASFILVMDLLIMMQDWDFPHFTTTLHINLPGFSVATLEWKYAEVHLTGKWFNYGLIFMVMLLDLNMWKNQIFYYPSKFGQYTGPDDKIRTVSDQSLLMTGNRSLWTWESRSKINETTGEPYYANDMTMNSRYMGYPLLLKCTAFIPSVIGLSLFVSVITLYGRFPNNQQSGNRSTSTTETCHGHDEAKDGVSV